MEILIFLIILLAPSIVAGLRNKEDLPEDLIVEKAVAFEVVLAIAALVVALIGGTYAYLQSRKMQKKNRPSPSQLDGTLAQEGVSFSSIDGSPHLGGNITLLWGQRTEAIKAKGGK